MFSLTGKFLVDPYTKAAAVWGRAACPVVSNGFMPRSLRRCQPGQVPRDSLNPVFGVPLTVHRKDKRAGLNRKFWRSSRSDRGGGGGRSARSGRGAVGCSRAYCVAKMNV